MTGLLSPLTGAERPLSCLKDFHEQARRFNHSVGSGHAMLTRWHQRRHQRAPAIAIPPGCSGSLLSYESSTDCAGPSNRSQDDRRGDVPLWARQVMCHGSLCESGAEEMKLRKKRRCAVGKLDSCMEGGTETRFLLEAS